MAKFELRDTTGHRIIVETPWVRVGRAEDNNVVLRDPRISRYHLNLFLKNGQLIVEDAGSQNGFLVNGNPAGGATQLNVGDRLFFGNREYVVSRPDMMAANAARVAAAPSLSLRATPVSTAGGGSNRLRLYGVAIVALVLVAVFAKQNDPGKRAPASVTDKDPSPASPLAGDGYRPNSFHQKGLTEVQAEGKYRESLRDYYDQNYSRAMLGFQEALTLNPAHEEAQKFLQLAETEFDQELKDLIKDGERSAQNLQLQRAKGQAARALTMLSDQIPNYGRKIAQDDQNPAGGAVRMQGQEEVLLGIPCNRTRNEKLCDQALDLLKRSRQSLGDEDTLK